MEIEQHIWGFTPEGEALLIYRITSPSGACVELTNIGAAVRSIRVPDRKGVSADVALGYKTPEGYIADGASMCKSVGRYANRIASGRFVLDGTVYQLARNNPPNHLHGGVKGFGSQLWQSRVESDRVVFSLYSPDGDEGYPGALDVEVSYYWSDENALETVYVAQSDAPTVVNLTNHLYLNLAGEGIGSVLGQELQLDCSRFLPVDAVQIPTGEMADVEGTPMDFRVAKPVGRDMNSSFARLDVFGGYDHCWVVDGWRKNILGRVGSLYDPASGRSVEVLSSQPGVQIYTGNYLKGTPESTSGRMYDDHDGIAIECQAFPDSPNHPEFPSVRVDAGERYVQKTVYIFGVR